jgi:Flp pilus assembly protein TadG
VGIVNRLRAAARRWALGFGDDRRGVAALEFALLAPILIILYFGMAELVQAMIVQRRVSHAASAVGDLVAQYETLSNDQRDDVFTAAANILSPFDAAGLELRVTSISGNAQGKPRVDWSDGKGGLSAYNHCDTVAGFPSGLVTAAGDNVVMAEAAFHYDSPIAQILPSGVNFNERFYLRPRKATKVARDGEDTSPCQS